MSSIFTHENDSSPVIIAYATVGHSLVNPSDLPSAVAQTASRTPETMRLTHDMTVLLASLVAHRVLIRRPGIRSGSVLQASRRPCARPEQTLRSRWAAAGVLR